MKPTIGLALAGMILDEAGRHTLDAIAPLQRELSRLPHGAMTGDEAKLINAIRLALDTDAPPTVSTLTRIDKTITAPLLSMAKRAADREDGPGSIRAAVTQLSEQYRLRVFREGLAAALGATEAGDLRAGLDSVASLDLGELYGAPERLHDFVDHDIDAPDAPRPFQLSCDGLNRAIGGGLGCGGTLGLSLWVAPSGHGKSSFWWGEIPHLCDQGHWVLYLAAEAPHDYVFNQIVRLDAALTEDAYDVAARRQVPRNAEKARASYGRLRALTARGQLQVWTDPFNPAKVRELAAMKLSQMKDAGATGNLIVIVDNYDALFEDLDASTSGGPQGVNQEMQKLQRHTREKDYHLALLAQASSDAETMLGPCGPSDVYGNKKLHMKVGLMVTQYRAKTPQIQAMTGPDGKPTIGARNWMAVCKKRGRGEEGKLIEFDVNNAFGAWREARQLPI